MTARDLRELAASATPGPWTRVVSERFPNAKETPSPAVVSARGQTVIDEFMPVTDADFIAAANPQRVLGLLDDLAAAESRVADLEATVARVEALWKAQMKGNSHKGTANVFVSVDSILRALVADATTRSEATT